MLPQTFRLSGNSLDAVKEALERTLSATSGQKVRLALLPSDVHDPTELPTYLAGYRNAEHRADEASPVVLVDKDEDKFRTFDTDDTFRRVDVKGSAQGMVPEVDPKSSLTKFKVTDRYIGSFIPDQTEANQTNPNYRPRMAAGKRCARALLLDRECDVFQDGLLGVNTSFAVANRLVLSAGQNWNGGASSNPILDLQTLAEASATPIDAYWMNLKLANAFVRHDKVKDHFRMFNGDAVLSGAIQQLGQTGKKGRKVDFDVPGVGTIRVVASKVKNESTGALRFIMNDLVVGTTVPDQSVPQDGEEIATSYTFRRRGPNGTGFETREFRVENRGPYGGVMVVASMGEVAMMTSTIAGGAISNAWA